VHLGDSAESVEAVLGCLAIGAVPLDMQRSDAVDELHALLAGANAVAVIHHRSDAPRFAALRDRLPKLRTLLSVDDGSGTDLSAAGSEDFESALAGAVDVRTFSNAPKSTLEESIQVDTRSL
jgi:acyl-CoA synthetase (AMP-forming)/AMP-acid ligase II